MNIRKFAREYFLALLAFPFLFIAIAIDLMKTMCLFDHVYLNHLNTQISRIFHCNPNTNRMPY